MCTQVLEKGWSMCEGVLGRFNLEGGHLVVIPDWRHILNECIEKNDKDREDYAWLMLREVLEDPGHREGPGNDQRR